MPSAHTLFQYSDDHNVVHFQDLPDHCNGCYMGNPELFIPLDGDEYDIMLIYVKGDNGRTERVKLTREIVHPSYDVRFNLCGPHPVTFRVLEDVNGHPVQFSYKGSETHPDLEQPLMMLVPMDEDDLENLCDEHNAIVYGVSNYYRNDRT